MIERWSVTTKLNRQVVEQKFFYARAHLCGLGIRNLWSH